MKIGIVVFNDVEELDFVGPWEVFGMSAKLGGDEQLVLVAEAAEPVRCAKGLRVLPDATFAATQHLDVVLVPGGQGTRKEVDNETLLTWLQSVAKGASWVTSVCTGSLLLHTAGLTAGKQVTTHWAYTDTLKGKGAQVLDTVRYVRDGNVVTAAGVSAGIDMALWLVGQLHTAEFARHVQRAMQYDPAPPYTAAV